MNINSKEQIKIIEKSGVKIEEMLVKKDPLPVKKCEKKNLENCFLCKSSGDKALKISCGKNNVGYGLVCDTCSERGSEMVYEGETSRSARLRGTEHLRG